jgi:hypothetical protein
LWSIEAGSCPGMGAWRSRHGRPQGTDGLPNHATGAFPNRANPNRISAQSYSFRMPLKPTRTGRAGDYRPNHLLGVAVNGVVFDPNTAEFWNDDRRSGWMIEVLSGGRSLGIDQNNAHVQPDGSYHYHGVPTGLVDKLGGKGAGDGRLGGRWLCDLRRRDRTIELTAQGGARSGRPGRQARRYLFVGL